MPFAIKYRRVDRRSEPSLETLAVDIENHDEAKALVDRLAGSYAQNGRHAPPMRWFRNRAGLHLIWAQQQ
ncbi:hypothetical protein [Methylobacterium haplocladii]|uniref:Uncharacterized protein n=1 Tax=Methylobacterium haplocladii TaxID=1176176 RepID=A0A512ITJ2_9HYPH|nr:hypothetical protein [Methylobacterium haplocladii]GEP01022.1 hypothetical protein MHA02_34090 [Methylobacterium haplocladii]GJD83222.1 hypothetical protein HPGCJGGD_1088 [Methylobacterium haplocladii]GLS61266.1 hypothetical protein GCM10007887_39640 [Methylobacterium haplocladii]